MEFNVRALCAAESVDSSTRLAVSDAVGKKIEFRSGISFTIELPSEVENFPNVENLDRILTSLQTWVRVYRYTEDNQEKFHCLTISEGINGDIEFYRLDLLQPTKSRKGLRPPVQILGGQIMDYEACTDWLISLSDKWKSIPASQRLVLQNPRLLKPSQMRIVFVGPEQVGGQNILRTIKSFGAVYGAEILHISPSSFKETRARINAISPIDAAIILRHGNPHLTSEVVSFALNPDRVYVSTKDTVDDILVDLRICIEVFVADASDSDADSISDENLLMRIIFRGMLAHAKIGQYKHCPKDTVLRGIRARKLNVQKASLLIDENSEQFQDNKDSDKLLLWKPHNDGDQYFINPRRVSEVKILVQG